MRNPDRESFLPLASGPLRGPASPSDARVTLLQQADKAKPFRPAVPELPPVPPLTGLGAPADAPHKPQITLQRQDGRVMRVSIRCVCGHTVELACVYGESH
jgi:hypothetical protein